MLKKINNSRAQANIGEYVLLFSLVMAFTMGMSVYFKRSVQARIREASKYSLNIVRDRAGNVYNGTLWLEYEPYYLNTAGSMVYASDETSKVFGQTLGNSGIFTKEIDTEVQMDSQSVVAPPKDAD